MLEKIKYCHVIVSKKKVQRTLKEMQIA